MNVRRLQLMMQGIWRPYAKIYSPLMLEHLHRSSLPLKLVSTRWVWRTIWC